MAFFFGQGVRGENGGRGEQLAMPVVPTYLTHLANEFLASHGLSAMAACSLNHDIFFSVSLTVFSFRGIWGRTSLRKGGGPLVYGVSAVQGSQAVHHGLGCLRRG